MGNFIFCAVSIVFGVVQLIVLIFTKYLEVLYKKGNFAFQICIVHYLHSSLQTTKQIMQDNKECLLLDTTEYCIKSKVCELL